VCNPFPGSVVVGGFSNDLSGSWSMERLVVDGQVCVGCGQCAMVCTVDALATQWGEIAVDEDLCVGCGVCVEYCPVDALGLEAT